MCVRCNVLFRENCIAYTHPRRAPPDYRWKKVEQTYRVYKQKKEGTFLKVYALGRHTTILHLLALWILHSFQNYVSGLVCLGWGRIRFFFFFSFTRIRTDAFRVFTLRSSTENFENALSSAGRYTLCRKRKLFVECRYAFFFFFLVDSIRKISSVAQMPKNNNLVYQRASSLLRVWRHRVNCQLCRRLKKKSNINFNPARRLRAFIYFFTFVFVFLVDLFIVGSW